MNINNSKFYFEHVSIEKDFLRKQSVKFRLGRDARYKTFWT